MSLKNIILSLCLASTTAYANHALIKEFDTSKNIARTLNNPSSSASQIDAFDEKTKHKKNTPAPHTTTKTNNHTEDIAKQTKKKCAKSKRKIKYRPHHIHITQIATPQKLITYQHRNLQI